MTTTGLMPRRCDAEEKNISGRIFSLLSKSKKNGHCPLLTGERGRQGQRRGNASGRRGKFPLFLGLALLFSESRSRSPFFSSPRFCGKAKPGRVSQAKTHHVLPEFPFKKRNSLPIIPGGKLLLHFFISVLQKRECSKTRDC